MTGSGPYTDPTSEDNRGPGRPADAQPDEHLQRMIVVCVLQEDLERAVGL